MSEDRRAAISVIAMLGSVFSPFYAAARARPESADPLAHAAFNVAVYTPRSQVWALTERGERVVRRSSDELVIGPSSARWEGDVLVIDLEERASPIPHRIAGTIRLTPLVGGGESIALDASGRHRWTPIAPSAHAEVDMVHPRLRFRGDGYMDANHGEEGLEAAFTSWTWSRVASARRATVTYDVERRDGSRLMVARAYERAGAQVEGPPVTTTTMAPTRWRISRAAHGEPGATPRMLRTLEDTPFYARSILETRFFGELAVGTHESLSLARFQSPIVQKLLWFRMRRVTA